MKQRIRLLVALFGLPLVAVCLLLLMDRLVMPLYTRQGSEAVLPDLRGLDSAAARERLQEQGFRVLFENGRADFSGATPAGAVLEQFPLPGSRTKTGRRVYLSPSLGEIRVRLPDRGGRTRREASLLLADLGLAEDSTAVRWIFDPGQGAGTVLRQSPSAGETLSRGETVRFVLSLGPRPEKVRVPSLLGLDLLSCERRLQEQGLRLGRVDFEERGDRPAGVRVQLPVAGQQLAPGDSVSIRLNRPSLDSSKETRP